MITTWTFVLMIGLGTNSAFTLSVPNFQSPDACKEQGIRIIDKIVKDGKVYLGRNYSNVNMSECVPSIK